jgi:hypothetical protein
VCLVFPLTTLGVLVILMLIRNGTVVKRNLQQIDRSLQLAEESLAVSKQALELQKETNRLLARLTEEIQRGR